MLYATVRQRKIYVKNPTTVIQKGIGVDQLILDMDEEWKEMSSIVCVFTLKYNQTQTTTQTVTKEDGTTEEVTTTTTVPMETAKEILHTFGQPVQVPWECLTETGTLSVSCTGYDGEEKVMTTMLPDHAWTVVQNGPMEGDVLMEPTPTLYGQILAAAGAASSAAANANATAAELQQARENGEFDGSSPTVAVGSVTGGTEAQVTNSGTPQAAVFNFVLPRGPQGAKGERGSQGLTGPQGPQGIPGTTPVRGVDYWTQADRAVIVAETLAALPVYDGEVK